MVYKLPTELNFPTSETWNVALMEINLPNSLLINSSVLKPRQFCIFSNLIEERMMNEDATALLTTISLQQEDIPRGSTTVSPYPLEFLKVKPGRYREVKIDIRVTEEKNNFKMNFSCGTVLFKLLFVKL